MNLTSLPHRSLPPSPPPSPSENTSLSSLLGHIIFFCLCVFRYHVVYLKLISAEILAHHICRQTKISGGWPVRAPHLCTNEIKIAQFTSLGQKERLRFHPPAPTTRSEVPPIPARTLFRLNHSLKFYCTSLPKKYTWDSCAYSHTKI